PEQVAGLAGFVFEAEKNQRDLSVGRGERQKLARLGGEVVGERKLLGLRRQLLVGGGPGRLGGEVNRNAGGSGRGLERRWHDGLANRTGCRRGCRIFA